MTNAYLYVLVNVPRSLFSIIHRFHCGVSHTHNITTCKYPGLTGLHGFWIYFWETPFVKLDGTQGFLH